MLLFNIKVNKQFIIIRIVQYPMENKKQIAMFNAVVEKIEQSTTSITELRVPIFSPVQKLSGNSITAREFKKNGGIRTINTSWGKVEIRGRKLLTQVHRDLLDCIYTNSTQIIPCNNGQVRILFSQTKILREYSGDKKNSSWENQTKWLKDKIKEIRDVTVNYVNTKGDSFDFNLISHLDYMEEYNSYSITLDDRYLKFYERELSINYKKELPKILKVDSALIKAIIRWFFTHKNESKYKLLTVLQALGYPVDSPKSLQVAKRELRNRIEELQTFGIDYDSKEEIFSYRGNDNVGFIPSLLNAGSKPKKSKTVENKKTITSLISKTIYLENKELRVEIKNIIYEKEGQLIDAAFIETIEGIDFRIKNNTEATESTIEEEVIEYLLNMDLK